MSQTPSLAILDSSLGSCNSILGMCGIEDCQEHQLSPALFLQTAPPDAEQSRKTALIILNSPFDDLGLLKALFAHSGFRLCADGGANRLHDLLVKSYAGEDAANALKSALPDAIHGDLDSLRDAVRQQYEQLAVPISRDGDQYSTDFGKAIGKVIEAVPEIETILVLGSIGGRVDQGIGLLHELYREQNVQHPNVRFWLFSEASVSTLLSRGSTRVQTPLAHGLFTQNMGILPLYGPASITTQGLEWDVADWPTEMGGQVSTSNHIVNDSITISTDRPVLLTIERAA